MSTRLKSLTPDQRAILTGDGWLSRQSTKFQDEILALGGVRQFEPGYLLYALDRQVSHIYGLIDGQIDVHLISSNFEEVAFPSAGRGKWYSFSDAVTGDRTAGSAIVRKRATMFCVTRKEFVAFLDEDPLRYRAIISHDNELRRHLQKVLMDSITGTETERVVTRLLANADDERTAPNKRLKLTQNELAALSGVSLPTVQRTFRLLKQFGVVETAYGEIGVVDREKLRDFARALDIP